MPLEQQSSLRLQDKCLAAGGASIISALVVNPLDVVKVGTVACSTQLCFLCPPHVPCVFNGDRVPEYASLLQTRMQAQQTVEVQLARMNTAVMG